MIKCHVPDHARMQHHLCGQGDCGGRSCVALCDKTLTSRVKFWHATKYLLNHDGCPTCLVLAALTEEEEQ